MTFLRVGKLGIRTVALSYVILGGTLPVEAGLHVTPLDSRLHVHTEARAALGFPLVVDDRSAAQGVALNPLAASARSESRSGAVAVVTTAQASSSWTDADHATVLLSNLGWVTTNVVNGRAAFAAEFTYHFRALEDSLLDLAWKTTATGSDLFGLHSFRFTFRDDMGQRTDSAMALGQQATYSRLVTAGREYTVEITTFFNVDDIPNINGGLGTRDAFQSGQFDLTVRDIPAYLVPEPGTLALMALATCLFCTSKQIWMPIRPKSRSKTGGSPPGKGPCLASGPVSKSA